MRHAAGKPTTQVYCYAVPNAEKAKGRSDYAYFTVVFTIFTVNYSRTLATLIT